MKVGIVTVYGDNYGNKLQNYALSHIVEEQGHICETIRIKNGYNLNSAYEKHSPDLSFSYIKKALKDRFRNRYPYKNQRDGYLGSIAFSKKDCVTDLAKKRSDAFKRFSDRYIRLSDHIIDANDGI